MSSFLLSAYILVWPILAAGVLLVLTHGVWKDVVDARREGESLV
ncbi:MAG: putative transporter small subunit [Pigmentiphaga sp.]|nr:putative transporter small subunit [Pigmentiphaga sp.]